MNQKGDICQKGRFRIKNETIRLNNYSQIEAKSKNKLISRFRVKSSKSEIKDFTKLKSNCYIKSQTVIRVYEKEEIIPLYMCATFAFSSIKEKIIKTNVLYLPLMRPISLSTSKKAVDDKTTFLKRNFMISNSESTCFSINKKSKS